MIFYFSGEGNSAWVAQQLSLRLGEKLIFMPDVKETSCFQMETTESLGFVFPCYGWHVPKFVTRFVTNLQISHVQYIWSVITCGDDTGLTGKLFEHCIESRGWRLDAAWALQMPETYVCLPWFDVDNPAQEERKIQMAKLKISEIAHAIIQRKIDIRDTLRGSMAWAKTYLLGTFFQCFLMSDKPFHVNQDCIGCGRCIQVCSRHNIKMQPYSGPSLSTPLPPNSMPTPRPRPVWLRDCIMCLSCYHHCPVHAIHWGRQTKKKGQYLCNISLSSLSH